jgi:Pyridoxamine 5'-phosphate oxidase
MTTNIAICNSSTEQNALPSGLVSYLDGNKLNERVGEAIYVTTIDQDGWPHASLLSVGEIVAVDASHLNLAVYSKASTAKNIERNGKVSLSMVHDRALWEVILDAKLVSGPEAGAKLALFKAQVKNVRVHRVDYADVLSSVTYSLHDKAAVVDRWKSQIADLRALMAA